MTRCGETTIDEAAAALLVMGFPHRADEGHQGG